MPPTPSKAAASPRGMGVPPMIGRSRFRPVAMHSATRPTNLTLRGLHPLRVFVFTVVVASLASTLALADQKKRTAKDIVNDFNNSMSLEEPAPPDLGPDPLGDIADRMTNIHGDLSSYKTDKPVQQKQQAVVSALDILIAKLQPKGGGSGGGNNPNGLGRKKSMIVDGDAKIGDLHGYDARAKQWGELPPKERERILQSRTEGFPAGYESLLQSYYQRLAQEKAADNETPPAPKK